MKKYLMGLAVQRCKDLEGVLEERDAEIRKLQGEQSAVKTGAAYWDAMRDKYEKLKTENKTLSEKLAAATEKLRQLGCALDVDGVNWVDPIPHPWPAAPSPSRDWVRGTCAPPPAMLPGTLIEYQNFAGQRFIEKAEDVISWNSVSWWRFLPVEKVITQKADEMLTCRGVAKPGGEGWVRGDSAEGPRDSTKVEFIRMDGHVGTRTARAISWQRVAWWRLAE